VVLGSEHLAVIVAVRAVRVMEMTADEMVDVVAMRKRFMSAALLMSMRLAMIAARVPGRTARGIRPAGGQHALVDVVTMDALQVPVVKVIGVVTVPNGLATDSTVRRGGFATSISWGLA